MNQGTLELPRFARKTCGLQPVERETRDGTGGILVTTRSVWESRPAGFGRIATTAWQGNQVDCRTYRTEIV